MIYQCVACAPYRLLSHLKNSHFMHVFCATQWDPCIIWADSVSCLCTNFNTLIESIGMRSCVFSRIIHLNILKLKRLRTTFNAFKRMKFYCRRPIVGTASCYFLIYIFIQTIVIELTMRWWCDNQQQSYNRTNEANKTTYYAVVLLSIYHLYVSHSRVRLNELNVHYCIFSILSENKEEEKIKKKKKTSERKSKKRKSFY